MEQTVDRDPHFRVVLAGAVVVSLLLLTLLSGCTMPGGLPGISDELHDTPVLLLDLHMRRDPDAAPFIVANGGACPMAKVEGDKVRLDRSAARLLDEDAPVLVVVPHTEGAWDVLAGQPSYSQLPARVEPMIELRTRLMATIDHDAANNTTYVDGAPVVLPHAWNLTAPDGAWEASLLLQRGPDQWRTFTQWFCRRD